MRWMNAQRLPGWATFRLRIRNLQLSYAEHAPGSARQLQELIANALDMYTFNRRPGHNVPPGHHLGGRHAPAPRSRASLTFAPADLPGAEHNGLTAYPLANMDMKMMPTMVVTTTTVMVV